LIHLRQLQLETTQVELDVAKEMYAHDPSKSTKYAVRESQKKLDALENEAASGFRLGDVIKARGSPEMLEKRVLLHPIRVHQEKKKFLVLPTSVAKFTNKVLCDDGSSYPLDINNAFLCAPDNALIDGRVAFATTSSTPSSTTTLTKPLLVFWQDKSTDVESKHGEVSVSDVKKWYHKAWTALEKFAAHYELCLFFASNRRLNLCDELEEEAWNTLFVARISYS